MLRTFNMGMGYLVIVAPEDAGRTLDTLSQTCEDPKIIGAVVPAEDQKVRYVGKPHYAG